MEWVPKYVERINTEDNKVKDWLRKAYFAAWIDSDDPQTKNGAVLVKNNQVVAYGVNKFPDGVIVSRERLEDRIEKLKRIEHAERNVIYNAFKIGVPAGNLIMVVPWYSCYDCGRAIIGSGIRHVIGHKDPFERTPDRWRSNIEETLEMMHEAGIKMQIYTGLIGNVMAMLNKEVWKP